MIFIRPPSNHGFWHRFRHKLFKCPTFWRFKPSFHCPICGKGYNCYWDGNDIEDVGIDVCNKCAKGELHDFHTSPI